MGAAIIEEADEMSSAKECEQLLAARSGFAFTVGGAFVKDYK